MKDDLNSSEYSLTVSRALTILSLFLPQRTEVSLAEISKLTGLSKQSVLRFVKSMIAHGYLEQDPQTKRYRPGIETFRVGSLVADPEVRKLALPFMRELSLDCGFTSYLSLMRTDSMIVLSSFESNSVLRFSLPVGLVVQLSNTSVGQAALSTMPDEDVRHLFERIPFAPGGPLAPQDIETLLKRLREVRRRGYSHSWEMSEPGVGSVSSPVTSPATRKTLVMTVGFGTGQIDQAEVDALGRKLHTAAERLGAELTRATGYRGA